MQERNYIHTHPIWNKEHFTSFGWTDLQLVQAGYGYFEGSQPVYTPPIFPDNRTTSVKFPWAIVILIAIIVGATVYFLTKRFEMSPAVEQKQKEIDSISKNSKESFKEAENNSQAAAEKATKIIIEIPRGKPIIKDTTYDYMSDYLLKYELPR